jgi:hypothetical protein
VGEHDPDGTAALFQDAELLEALRSARGDDRTLLVIGLGDAHGDRGPGALRELYASEKGHVRAAALASLAQRTGPASTDVCWMHCAPLRRCSSSRRRFCWQSAVPRRPPRRCSGGCVARSGRTPGDRPHRGAQRHPVSRYATTCTVTSPRSSWSVGTGSRTTSARGWRGAGRRWWAPPGARPGHGGAARTGPARDLRGRATVLGRLAPAEAAWVHRPRTEARLETRSPRGKPRVAPR